jgi:hypothetical protein
MAIGTALRPFSAFFECAPRTIERHHLCACMTAMLRQHANDEMIDLE